MNAFASNVLFSVARLAQAQDISSSGSKRAAASETTQLLIFTNELVPAYLKAR